ncbi:hypothetical protein DUNSADRAFT_13229 [Dunaliella salina]|uniref:Encoded protein n=1 Tax=Dunaliella salina TaxID=3046 RepID=A0ABQ7H3B9_DUNSA|nr:hypothetical protein DUNSADRAFT_13229 [Dunaliella salina]|eukprot:KAF5841361.1 hypothetical protein DUNSADRAFT_13229 [Dunaliella salina]
MRKQQSSFRVTGSGFPKDQDAESIVPKGSQLHPQKSSDSSVSSVSAQSEIGWDPKSASEGKGRRLGGGLSQADRELIQWQRPPAGEDDEKELRPLPGVQKVVQHGQALEAAGSLVLPNFDGLCLAINPSNDTVAVGCRYSKVLVSVSIH